MPIRSSSMARVLSRIENKLPTREFGVTRGTSSLIAFGYLRFRGVNLGLDSLGFRDQDAILYVREGEILVGDEIDQTYVVWSPYQSDHYTAFTVRKIPPWDAWIVRKTTSTGIDPNTLEPVTSTNDVTFYGHMVRLNPNATNEMSGLDMTSQGVLVTKPTQVSPLDRVQHPTHGTYRVIDVLSYGPYERAYLGAA